MLSTSGKSEDQIADEVMAALRQYQTEQDHTAEPGDEPTEPTE